MASLSWPTFTFTVDCQAPRSLLCSALDFLIAITVSGVSIYDSSRLQIRKFGHLSLGSGGFATVHEGQISKGEIVAVKQSRLRTQSRGKQETQAFERELYQLCLELRILSHGYLRGHPSIVNVLGICLDEDGGQPYLSLILEYSPYGTLKSFLVKHRDTFPDKILVDFMLQVSRGIEALHRLRICHGDVKTENALIFQSDGSWTVKVSDFGQSIVGAKDLSATVNCNIGTRLMNAPEIRSGVAMGSAVFDIEFAMLTDIFSFGLLAWEVMKKGQCYFEDSWVVERSEDINVDLKENYLNALPHNELLRRSIYYLEGTTSDSCTRTRVERLLRGSLQDFPHERKPMLQLTKILDTEVATNR